MRMNSRKWLLLCLSVVVIVLSACGEKSKEDVIKQMDKQLTELDGYKAKAEMTMKSGEEDQKYHLDIWYKEEDFYRVALKNNDDEQSNQVILKNEDGVFVVTPALNKSFKFQSDWPETSSQPYLYQSLLSDIKNDEGAQFEATDSHYKFTTKTHYQSNQNLPQQEIYLNKKTYVPEIVKVLDKDSDALVEVTFSEFELDPQFEKNDFALKDEETKEEANTDEAKEETDEADEEEATTDDESEETVGTIDSSDSESLEVMYPAETVGATLKEEEEIKLENGKRIIMTYDGDKTFTLVQENRDTIDELETPREVNGQIVNLGTTIGALSNNTIEWSERGNYYKIASDELTKEELISVAQSIRKAETK